MIYTLSSMWVRGTDENTVINEDSSSWFIHCNQCGFEALMKILSSMRIRVLDLYIVINAGIEVRGTDENTAINEDSSSWFIHCNQCGFEALMKILSSMRIRVLDLYIVINAGSRSWWKYCHQWGFEELIYIHCHQCGFEVLMKILSLMRIRVLDLYIVINAGSRHWWKYCHQWGFEFLIYTL